jgi:hypothetical protein
MIAAALVLTVAIYLAVRWEPRADGLPRDWRGRQRPLRGGLPRRGSAAPA